MPLLGKCLRNMSDVYMRVRVGVIIHHSTQNLNVHPHTNGVFKAVFHTMEHNIVIYKATVHHLFDSAGEP